MGRFAGLPQRLRMVALALALAVLGPAGAAALTSAEPGVTTSYGYAVFGQVLSGMDVVEAIGQVPTGDNGPMPGQAPVTPIIVKKVTLLK